MNKLKTDNIGGFPLTLDDIRWNDDAYREAMNSILRAFGDNYIVQGCAVNGSSIASGYVMLNGDLLKVDAHNAAGGGYYQKITTLDDASGVKLFKTGTTFQTHQMDRAVATAGSGSLAYNGLRLSDLVVFRDDPRLSNSRQCNNDFDDAITARQHLNVYSKEENDAKIANLVNSAPSTLDTLNELADALGNDANFASSISSQIGLKANSSEVYNKSEVFTKNESISTFCLAGDARLDNAREIRSVNGNTIHTLVLEIGPWNMNEEADIGCQLPTGLANKIIAIIDIMIISDDGMNKHSLMSANALNSMGTVSGGLIRIMSNDYLSFMRFNNIFFNSNYSSTSINRGYVTLLYID